MSVPSDRNLLFGILALQLDFITRDQLVAAMHAWVLAKDKPLGRILREQSALDARSHDLLDALVHKHLALHDDDARKSLAAVSSIQSARQELAALADPDVQASLVHVGAARVNENATATELGAPTTPGMRFRILRAHARGGLGEVFVARDQELPRDVALKEIQEKHAHSLDARARFLLEAEVTGALEHPGIVPVYGLGNYADGRPFYAMRFIRGDSLKDAIARFHAAAPNEKSPSSPVAEGSSASLPGPLPPPAYNAPRTKPKRELRLVGERLVEFRKLLGRFLDVCQAIAYAHSRGVLHRDLKPGNIMLGKYGETLVVDWGLAKTLNRNEPETNTPGTSLEPPVRPTQSGSAETVAGAAMGTPAYMSPEQAEGRLDLLGPASDVYCLGATLYSLLTGEAPFGGGDVLVILSKVRRGEFPPPRQLQPAIPRGLEAICLKAMALRPQDRYASPKDLADDVEHWLADEPVAAHRESMRTRLARWGRRHKTLVTSGVVLLITAVAALSVGLLLLGQKQLEVVQERDTAEKARRQAEAIGKFYEDHVLAAARPKGWGGGAGRDVTLKDALDQAGPKIDEAFAHQPELEATVRHTLGKTYWYLGRYEAANAHLEKAQQIRLERLGKDHPDTLTSLHNLAMQRWRQDKLDEAATMAREALEGRRRVLGLEHEDTLWTQLNLGLFLSEQGHPDEAEPLLRQAIEACKRTLGPDHHHTLYGKHDLAILLTTKGDYNASLALDQQALDGRRRSLGRDHPDTLRSLGNLAISLWYLDRLDEAEAICREALEARRRVLGEDHTETFWSRGNLAGILADRGKLAEAEELRRQTLKVGQRLRGQDDPETLVATTELARFLRGQGKLEEADELFRQAVDGSRRKLGPEHPSTLLRQHHYAWLMSDREQTKEAEALYRQTLDSWLRVRGPEHVNTQSTKNNLGAMLSREGKYAEAEVLFRELLEVRRRILGPDHPNTLFTQTWVAGLLRDQCKWEEAERLHRSSVETNIRLYGFEHSSTLTSQGYLARLFMVQGKPEDAGKLYRQIFEIQRRVLGPENPATLTTQHNVALALEHQGKLEDAEKLYRETLEIRRRVQSLEHMDTMVTQRNLGRVLGEQRNLKEAEDLLRKVLEIERRVRGPEDSSTLLTQDTLATLLGDHTRAKEAESLYRNSLEIQRRRLSGTHPALLETLAKLGNLLEEQGRLAEAKTTLKEVLDTRRKTLLPDHLDLAATLGDFGYVLTKSGRANEGEPLLRECLAIRERKLPAGHWRIANAKSLLGGSLLGQKKFADAEPLLLAGYEGVTKENGAPARAVALAIDRIIDLHEKWETP